MSAKTTITIGPLKQSELGEADRIVRKSPGFQPLLPFLHLNDEVLEGGKKGTA